jgi:SMC interacting uncharacterized protein involved in chromosome segregation
MVINLSTERARRADAADREALARRLDKLRARQEQRIAAVDKQKRELDESLERADREIANLAAQLGEGL